MEEKMVLATLILIVLFVVYSLYFSEEAKKQKNNK